MKRLQLLTVICAIAIFVPAFLLGGEKSNLTNRAKASVRLANQVQADDAKAAPVEKAPVAAVDANDADAVVAPALAQGREVRRAPVEDIPSPDAVVTATAASSYALDPRGSLSGTVVTVDPSSGRFVGIQDCFVHFVRFGKIVKMVHPGQGGNFVADGLPAGYYSVIVNGPAGFGAQSIMVFAADDNSAQAGVKGQATPVSYRNNAKVARRLNLSISAIPPIDQALALAMLNRNAGNFSPVGFPPLGPGGPGGYGGGGFGGGSGGGGGGMEGGLGGLLGAAGLAAGLAAANNDNGGQPIVVPPPASPSAP